ncbi:MotA/TolQ/ExbB proton channel family protein [Zavarzinella formosa]|uniref:MotA/TolQ/ExbB proton channel family protein n=1 Tax=Zavarzinella formosa TaxID=360055 RepID=UPI0002EA8E76|nr:MotA/TolQ/ExbB proton channel family protein [Zavarzinella formosa]
MRRLLILQILPTAFCLLPIGAAFVIIASIPSDAMRDYLNRVQHSAIDWVILGFGTILFVSQILLAWRAMRWVGTGFDETQDRWLNHLATAAEWFPLLGLIGTVAAILQTFSAIGAPTATAQDVMPREIIRRYAPAITATGSGLFMALMNILPTWIVLLGRDLIRSLAGGKPPTGDAA